MSGCATLSGIAVLENPRTDVGQNLLFDAHFWFGDEPGVKYAHLGLLRYYNAENMLFDQEEPKKYFVHVNVARMELFCNRFRLQEDLDIKDYVLAGDIVQMIPLPDEVEPKYRPFLSVCGVVTSYNRDAEEKKIDVAPTVFTHVLSPRFGPSQDDDDKGKAKEEPAHPSPSFPVSYIIPNTSRYAGKRAPKVSVGTYVCLEGFLHSTHRKLSDGMVDYFDAELDKVTFLGRAFNGISSRRSLPTSNLSSPTPANKRLKFSYADTTPTPAPKRKAEILDREPTLSP